MSENNKELALKQKDEKLVEKLSIQQRAEDLPASNLLIGSFEFGTTIDPDDIHPWWSERRERDLRIFWMRPGNDILQGAVSSMVKKFKAMNWVLEGPNRVISQWQERLAESEFGEGWGMLLSKTITDYLTQDKGAFWELIGQGDPAGPIQGPVLGIAHLDSGLCQLTGDMDFPVIFNNPKDDKPHKLHTTRVIHLVDMASPIEIMNEVGFCGVSRVISSSQILLRLAKYKNEKLSDLPMAGIMAVNNVLRNQFEDQTAEFERGHRRMGHTIWRNIMALFSVDPLKPITLEFTSFADLPEAFDEQVSTDIYINVVALAFGVDAREFWPLSVGPLGTATETLVQHQKARGKGVGEIIGALERAINWKILPPSVSFKFDFKDDDEDKLQAEIADQRTQTIMRMWEARQVGDIVEQPPVTRLEVRQMLADNVIYFQDEFLEVDLTETEMATDTEQEEKMFGVKALIDRKGRMKRERVGKIEHTDSVLEMAEQAYRDGNIVLDDLVEFRVGEMMDKKLLKEKV